MSITQKGLETTDLLYQHGKKATKKYLLLLFSGIALAFVPFLIMSWVGVETGSRWLIMMGGIWRVIIGVGVSIIFAFIAIPILLVTKGREGPAIYMRAVLGAVLVALSTSLILMITPLTSNTQNIPIFIMCLIIGGIIITVNFNVKPIAWLVGIVFFLTFLSFFLPNKFSEAGRAIHEFDQGSLDLPRFSELEPKVRNTLPKREHGNEPHLESQKAMPPQTEKSETLAPIAPSHDIAVIISNSPGDSELIASALREKGKDAVSATSLTPNLARYIIKGRKLVKFVTDRTFGSSDIIEARVSFDIQMIDAQSGTVIKNFHVIKNYSGLSRESAERTTTKSALDSVNENLS